MSPDKVFLGLFVGVVPAAAVIFGLVSFGIIALGKSPASPDDTRKPKAPSKEKADLDGRNSNKDKDF